MKKKLKMFSFILVGIAGPELDRVHGQRRPR